MCVEALASRSACSESGLVAEFDGHRQEKPRGVKFAAASSPGHWIDYSPIPGKSQRSNGNWTMRGLVMALFALDLPGSNGSLKASRWAGGFGAPFLSRTTTTKASTKKTAKTV